MTGRCGRLEGGGEEVLGVGGLGELGWGSIRNRPMYAVPNIPWDCAMFIRTEQEGRWAWLPELPAFLSSIPNSYAPEYCNRQTPSP